MLDLKIIKYSPFHCDYASYFYSCFSGYLTLSLPGQRRFLVRVRCCWWKDGLRECQWSDRGTCRRYNFHLKLSKSVGKYVELVGVELVLLFTHVSLLQFVQSLLFSLFLQELRVLLLIKGSLLFTEDVADEAIWGLFWCYVLFLAPSMVYQLKLALKSILHLHTLFLLLKMATLPLFTLFFLLALLDFIHDLMLELSILSHLLVEDFAILIINSLILLVLLSIFVAISILLVEISLILVEQVDFLLFLPPSFLFLMH